MSEAHTLGVSRRMWARSDLPGVIRPIGMCFSGPIRRYNGMGGFGDGLGANLNAAGSARVYYTSVGAVGQGSPGIAVDGSGNPYLTRNTNSTDFPTLS
jgi:hypothetical protein